MIVSSNLENVRCSQSGQVGPPACDSGSFCGAGRCRLCEPKEACGDGLDNDCNGLVDDSCHGEGGSAGLEEGGRTNQ